MADSKLRNAFYMAYLLTLILLKTQILRELCSKHEPLYVANALEYGRLRNCTGT